MLQHLPTRKAVLAYLAEFARVLKPGGEAFVQLPVLDDGAAARLATLRSALVPLTSLGPTRRREFRGTRLTRNELDAGLERVGFRVVATDVGPDAPVSLQPRSVLPADAVTALALAVYAVVLAIAAVASGGDRSSRSTSSSSGSRCTTRRWTRSMPPESTATR